MLQILMVSVKLWPEKGPAANRRVGPRLGDQL